MYGAGFTQQGQQLWIVTEFIEGCLLYDLLHSEYQVNCKTLLRFNSSLFHYLLFIYSFFSNVFSLKAGISSNSWFKCATFIPHTPQRC